MKLDKKIEIVLFLRGEPVQNKEIASLLRVSEEEITESLELLSQRLSSGGLRLLRTGTDVQLATAPEFSSFAEELQKAELQKDLGKAGAETLAIILYKGPLSRLDIDYIRGVNSTFIIRTLMIRGLIERETNPKDQRSFFYRPTTQLLAYLGVADVTALPNYRKIQDELREFLKTPESMEQS